MDSSGVQGPSPPVRTLPVEPRDKHGRPFVVREFRVEDRPQLESFYEGFEPKRAAQGLPPLGADRVARWLDAVLPIGLHLLVEADGALLGHALLVPTGRAGESEYAIFLSQHIRGRGLGTEVNQVAVEAARALGLKRVWLSVEPHNRPAIRSYEKVGFRFLPNTVFSPEAEMQLEL